MQRRGILWDDSRPSVVCHVPHEERQKDEDSHEGYRRWQIDALLDDMYIAGGRTEGHTGQDKENDGPVDAHRGDKLLVACGLRVGGGDVCGVIALVPRQRPDHCLQSNGRRADVHEPFSYNLKGSTQKM